MTQVARRLLRIDGTLDVECADWDVFCVGAVYDGSQARVFYDPNEMLDYLLERGGVYFAHAGGVYDLLLILECARRRGISCQIDRAQHRVTRIVMGRLMLRDSYALWPAPLDDLAGAIGEPVPKLPWPCLCCQRCGMGRNCHCGRGCGGYCQIGMRARMGDPDLEDYVCSDARVLYRALVRIRDVAADHGICLRGTLGQTAWTSAQDELGIPDSNIPFALWRHARQADKGGRIAVVRPRVGDVYALRDSYFDPATKREYATREPRHGVVGAHHDICNAYPAQLARAELPVGACRELGGVSARLALDAGMPGVYTISVSVPEDSFLPPLPWNKASALCFPTGEFAGTWTLPEIHAALARGVEIRQVHTALVWEASAPVFADLVQRWYAVRRALGRKTPIGQWFGGLAKALTGVLAMRPDRDRVVMFPDPESVKVCSRRGPCRRKCTRRCGAYEQLDLAGYIWAVPYHKMAASAYPQWSAYLRSMTRVQWLSQAERMGEVRSCGACGEELAPGTACASHPDATVALSGGGRALCLGNTDSLWHTSRQTPEPLGDGLGQWEYQHAWSVLEVRAPTVYAFRDPAEDSRKLHIRGVPGISEDDWRRGAGVLNRGIITFGRAVGTDRGLFRKRERRWSLPKRDRTLFGDRRLAGDGLTYPLSADELREVGRLIEEKRRAREQVREGSILGGEVGR